MINNAYDLTIIGGGPVGMYSAYYASLRGLTVKIIDSLPELGGQLKTLYPEKYIYDVPGFPKIKAIDLINNLHQQMSSVNDSIDSVLNETVEYVNRRDLNRILEICTNIKCHYSKTVLITAGKGAFQPRTLGLQNENTFRNIHYYVNDIERFKDKKIVIFGGGDSAVDWANMLSEISSHVTLVHRRKDFRAHEHSLSQLEKSDVEILTPYIVKDLIGKDGLVQKIIVENTNTKVEQTIEIDEVIVLFGYLSSLGPIETWELDLENRSLLVDSTQKTNILGIYAAGDACVYPGKVKMITTGFGEATIAVNSIYEYLNPDKKNTVAFTSRK